MGFEITLRNVPGSNNSITLPEGASVKDLAEHVANFSGAQIRVNGEAASGDTALKAGDSVMATRAPKGA